MPKTRKEAKNVGLGAKEPEKSAKPPRTLLGASTVQSNYRLALRKNVREKLNAEVGDVIIFAEDENGNIFLKIVKK
jgi:hypothetical protein